MERQMSKPRSQELCSGLQSLAVGVFFLQFISSLFHIKEIIVKLKFIVRFFQTNNVFTEAEARGLPSKRFNVCLMCLLFDISLEYISVC